MVLTRSEENKNKAISALIAFAIFGLLLLFLVLYNLITPNPPFPEMGGGGGQEFSLGMINAGNDNIDYGSMGGVTDVVAQKETPKEDVVTSDNGEDVQMNEAKPEIKSNTTVITPVKPKEDFKEKTDAEKLIDKFKKNTGKNGGGIANNKDAGENGSPTGDPFKNGNGGNGDGTSIGDGNGDREDSNPGKGSGFGGGIGIDLKGRAVVKPPKLPSDTKEEGRVVVRITVDSEGNVIEADPNGRGTNTSSALLKAKAKQAALATKFNVDGKFEEQMGTITIIFSFN